MKFGVREICDVVFKATADGTKVGGSTFQKGQPVLYIDTAKTSSLDSAATTVYAQGGKGNSRLLAWEGEKTLTFTVEDAMLSPLGFSVLSGAGLLKASTDEPAAVHMTVDVIAGALGAIKITAEDLGLSETDPAVKILNTTSAPVYGTVIDDAGAGLESLGKANTVGVGPVDSDTDVAITFTNTPEAGDLVRLDFYVEKTSQVQELQIDAGSFGGYYYVEASTLFRDQATGEDFPAEFILPKVKIQSNFTFAMASTGDPSTFKFVMDAFPGPVTGAAKKVLCAIQILKDDSPAG